MQIILIQIPVTADQKKICEKLWETAGQDIDIEILPEMFVVHLYDTVCFRASGEPKGDRIHQTLSTLAKTLHIH